jgi:hypothetical protein
MHRKNVNLKFISGGKNSSLIEKKICTYVFVSSRDFQKFDPIKRNPVLYTVGQ